MWIRTSPLKIDRSMKTLHPLLFVLCLHPVVEGKDLKPGTNRL